MRSTITYVAHYGNDVLQHGCRVISGAAVSKIDYIIGVINRLGINVRLLSTANSAVSRSLPQVTYHVSDDLSVKLKKAFPRDSLKGRILNPVSTDMFLSSSLRGLDEDDIVICYHAIDYIETIIRLKKKYKFKLVLEVEEVYSDVMHDDKLRTREESIFQSANGFILSTHLLRSSCVALREKPFVVCSGIYRLAPRIPDIRNDDLIHVVYAGTLDPRKGGAAAAAAGALLDNRYMLHILGSGNGEQIRAIKNAVAEANQASRGCKIIYEGFKSGREFEAFIQSCHIGLSPQDSHADFNATSFPSKVFMYLSNGLKVVSVDLPVFTPQMKRILSIVPNNSAECIAAGIKRIGDVDSLSYESVENDLALLNEAFTAQLADLLASVS